MAQSADPGWKVLCTGPQGQGDTLHLSAVAGVIAIRQEVSGAVIHMSPEQADDLANATRHVAAQGRQQRSAGSGGR